MPLFIPRNEEQNGDSRALSFTAVMLPAKPTVHPGASSTALKNQDRFPSSS